MRISLIVPSGCVFVGALSLSGCLDMRPSPDLDLSYIDIRGVKEITQNEKIQWVPDAAEKPTIISVGLGAKEMAEVRKLNSNLDLALKEYIGAEIRHRKLCDSGFEIRLGQRGGTKRGNYGFGLNCFWLPVRSK